MRDSQAIGRRLAQCRRIQKRIWTELWDHVHARDFPQKDIDLPCGLIVAGTAGGDIGAGDAALEPLMRLNWRYHAVSGLVKHLMQCHAITIQAERRRKPKFAPTRRGSHRTQDPLSVMGTGSTTTNDPRDGQPTLLGDAR